MGCGVRGLGCGVWGLGFGVGGWGLGVGGWGLGVGGWGLEGWGLGAGVGGWGLEGWGLGVGVGGQGLGSPMFEKGVQVAVMIYAILGLGFIPKIAYLTLFSSLGSLRQHSREKRRGGSLSAAARSRAKRGQRTLTQHGTSLLVWVQAMSNMGLRTLTHGGVRVHDSCTPGSVRVRSPMFG